MIERGGNLHDYTYLKIMNEILGKKFNELKPTECNNNYLRNLFF